MDKIAAPIPEAAALVGLGVSTLRRLYIKTGLVVPVDLGGRGLSILLDDLRAAIKRRAAEQVADPTQIKHRNAGGQKAALGIAPNPWGRKGKPAEVARKAARKS
jgi:hypothetical protein